MKNYYVYTHSLAGKPPFYVGKAGECRIKRIDRKSNPHHTRIVAKYGKENIIIRAMLCRSEQHALDLEVRLIAALRNDGVKLVNMTDGGDGVSGWIPSAETRAKMSATLTGKIKSPGHRAKISAAAMGKVRSPETCERISAAKKNPSPETRAKLSAANTGRKLSPEIRAKMSRSSMGIASSQIGKKLSPESIAKRTATRRANILAKKSTQKLLPYELT